MNVVILIVTKFAYDISIFMLFYNIGTTYFWQVDKV